MDETEVSEVKEIRDSIVSKFPIKTFGRKGDKIRELFPEAKLLVFTSEPWTLTGTHAVAVNEKVLYALGKWKDEHLIIAEKRIGEFLARTNTEFKVLHVFQGESLSEMTLSHPLFNERDIPVKIYNEITPTYGSGINSVSPGHDIISLQIALVRMNVLL
jgi:isoleucyl-tRNA synthetase